MMSSYPIYTKQTKCNNNLTLENRNDFLRPILSNTSIPISSNHDHYMFDPYAITQSQYDIERSSISTRNNVMNAKAPVQQTFQHDYYTTNFDNFNHNNNQEINKYLTRNPTNTRRDSLEKSRNQETQNFMKTQEGLLGNFIDIKCENTRQNKGELNSAKYIPMPRTMAIPKENI